MRDDDRESGPPAWRRYLRLTKDDGARDVDDEVAFHLESTVDEYVSAGLSPDAARREASAKFGDVEGIRRTLYTLSEQRERTMDRSEWWSSVKQDVVFGLRQLRRTPGFTMVALLTLALGIGANSAIFSVVNAVMLSPLPYANSTRLLRLFDANGQGYNAVTFGNYASWKEQARSFERLAASWGGGGGVLTGYGDPTPITGTRTSGNYFQTLNIKPVIGSYYVEADDAEGAPPVVVLSAALWQNRFGSDPKIIGKSIALGGTMYRVVAVAPQDYVLTPPAERVWMPLRVKASKYLDHKDHELTVTGLVKAGVSNEQAINELSGIARNLAKQYPNSGFDDVKAMPLAEAVVGDQGKILYMLFGAVTLVLLIACANVANLLIARGARRRAEIAVRGALGASRGRIVRQLLIESMLLGLAGGVLGMIVALAGIKFLVTSPASLPRLEHTSLNGTVIAFTMLLATGCAVIFGLVPALRASRADLQQTLRDGGRESATGARDVFRGALVVGELCLAQVLLIAAALLIRSTMLMSAVPAGFDTHNLLAFSLTLPGSRYQGDVATEAGFQQIENAISAIPGVKAVGRAQVVPIYGGGWNWTAMREGSNGHDDASATADMRGVSPNYFAALGLPLLRGRAFTPADGPDAPKVAIVSRALATRLYGNADPIGRRISNGTVESPNWREVVGVVDDMHSNGPGDPPPLTMYMPASDWVNGGQTLVVRGNVPVLTLVPQIRRAVASVDPLLALSRVSTIDQSLTDILAMPRFTMLLLVLLGGTGLVLAVVGVYGVISFFVTARTHEFGVRLALGASGGAVQWLVVRQGIGLALGGMMLGVGLASFVAKLMQSLVFGITPRDPLTFTAVAALLGLVAVAASYIPARRATRIDPLQALRSS